jgi:hypothetical protein
MPPSPPPANTNATAPVVDPSMLRTNRQLFEERTASPACQACHKAINGIGYGFEAYDAIGRYRSAEGAMPVDARGELLGTDIDGAFSGPIELSGRLAASRQVRNCAVKNWYRYAFGRGEEPNDACMLDAYYRAMEQSGGSIRELLVKLATSYPFMHRPGIAP